MLESILYSVVNELQDVSDWATSQGGEPGGFCDGDDVNKCVMGEMTAQVFSHWIVF